MAYTIGSGCIGCGACAASCPAGAITPGYGGKYEIDPKACVGCGACASGCPVGAPHEA